MKQGVRIVGHRLVKRGELEILEVRVSNVEGFRGTFPADPGEIDKYPIGSEGTFGWTTQMSMPLSPGTGGRTQENKSSRRAGGGGKNGAESEREPASARPPGPDTWPPDGAEPASTH